MKRGIVENFLQRICEVAEQSLGDHFSKKLQNGHLQAGHLD
jgi:hypothetical protein